MTNGDGYEYATDGEKMVAIHRLTAVAEHGVDAVAGNDVHHENVLDGASVPWFNARDKMAPEDPVAHRSRTLRHAAD